MDFGDPSGVSFARPLDLNAAGDVELWLEGHSCVHRERYDYRELLADKPKGTSESPARSRSPEARHRRQPRQARRAAGPHADAVRLLACRSCREPRAARASGSSS